MVTIAFLGKIDHLTHDSSFNWIETKIWVLNLEGYQIFSVDFPCFDGWKKFQEYSAKW